MSPSLLDYFLSVPRVMSLCHEADRLERTYEQNVRVANKDSLGGALLQGELLLVPCWCKRAGCSGFAYVRLLRLFSRCRLGRGRFLGARERTAVLQLLRAATVLQGLAAVLHRLALLARYSVWLGSNLQNSALLLRHGRMAHRSKVLSTSLDLLRLFFCRERLT